MKKGRLLDLMAWRSIALAATLIAALVGTATAQQLERSAQDDKDIRDTVDAINSAFMRSNLPELSSYMLPNVTMMHGYERLNDLNAVEGEWTKLFNIRKEVGMNYTLRISDLLIQTYGDSAIVTFSYRHPRLSGARITSESGKAVYVMIRQQGPRTEFSFAAGQKKPWVMAHCSLVADRAGARVSVRNTIIGSMLAGKGTTRRYRRRRKPRMMRPSLIGWPIALAFLIIPLIAANGHGDPQLEDQKVTTILVKPELGSYGIESFFGAVSARCATERRRARLGGGVTQKEGIKFSILADGIIKMKDLRDGAKTRTLRGEQLAIGQVSGASEPFAIIVYAHVVHWDQ